MLTQREAVTYLLRRKLLDPARVVAGDLAVADISRRHRNYRITSRRGPRYVVKLGVGRDRCAALAREAAVYRRLGSAAGPLRRCMPRLVDYDADAHVLVLELVDGAENLREYHLRRGAFQVSLARVLGTALGTLHRGSGTAGGDAARRPPTSPPPWVFALHRPTLEFLQECSRANLQLIEVVQQYPAFGELLAGLGEEWRTTAFIHHDVRWDNCIVHGRSPAARRSRLKLIDWELAGPGDPCWDVGSVFSDYLSFWLLSMPVTGELPPTRYLELARFPLERMQPALRAFWAAWLRRLELDAATADRRLVLAVRYAAGRLVQTAFEQTQTAMQLTGNVLGLLQVGLNMLQRPEEATVRLLGIPLQKLRLS